MKPPPPITTVNAACLLAGSVSFLASANLVRMCVLIRVASSTDESVKAFLLIPGMLKNSVSLPSAIISLSYGVFPFVVVTYCWVKLMCVASACWNVMFLFLMSVVMGIVMV